MSSNNGNGRIVSLEAARNGKTRKANDFITVAQAQQMVVEETTKIHEHYLNQIPQYCAKMIQDALIDLKLVKVVAGPEGVPMIVRFDDERPEWEQYPVTNEGVPIVATPERVDAEGCAETLPTDSEGPETAA